MTQMILEDLDPAIVERLELLAKEHRRSLQAELKHILETAAQSKILIRSHIFDQILRVAKRLRNKDLGGDIMSG